MLYAGGASSGFLWASDSGVASEPLAGSVDGGASVSSDMVRKEDKEKVQGRGDLEGNVRMRGKEKKMEATEKF